MYTPGIHPYFRHVPVMLPQRQLFLRHAVGVVDDQVAQCRGVDLFDGQAFDVLQAGGLNRADPVCQYL